MKEIYQAFRSAGVDEMQAITVTDSFNDVINRLEKESAESKARFEKESAEFDKSLIVVKLLGGLIMAFMVGITTTYVLS